MHMPSTRQTLLDDDDDLRAAIEAIWARNGEASLGRVAALEEAVAALIESRLSDQQRRDAERKAHLLAGSVGMFGFQRASEAARRLESALAGTDPVPADRLLVAMEEVVALRADLERDRPDPRAGEPQRPASSGISAVRERSPSV